MPAAALTILYGLRTHRALTIMAPFATVKAALTIRTDYSTKAALEITYSLRAQVQAALEMVYGLTVRGRRACSMVYDLAVNAPARAALIIRYSLLPNIAAMVQVVRTQPFIQFGEEEFELLEANVQHDVGGHFWNATVKLAHVSDFRKLARHDAVTLNIHGDEYEMVVEGVTRLHQRGQDSIEQDFIVRLQSRLWLTLGAEGNTITRTWDEPVMARAAVQELAGETVDWEIVNWQIPANVLAPVDSAAIDVIDQIAAAAGAVVESKLDGTLRVRYRWPVSKPDIDTAVPDVTLSEFTDIYSINEVTDSKRYNDKFTLSNDTDTQGFIAAERDPEQHDDIFGGEGQDFFVYLSEDVEVQQVVLSDGTLIPRGDDEQEVEEEITFVDTNEAELSKPVDSDFDYTWFGDGLGALTVQPNGRTVRAAQTGVAVAKVTYTVRAKRYTVRSPETSGGESVFPIQVHVIGELNEDERSSTAVRIIVQRGAGESPGEDIVEPLAGNDNVLFNRGRNAIDEAEPKHVATVNANYVNASSDTQPLLNGMLVEYEDSQLGETVRGLITNVQHKCEQVGVSSTITVERYA